MTSLNAQTHDLGEGLTTITFDEFTWDDGNGGYKMVSAANLVKLLGYSRAHYPGVTSLDEKPPYLVIWCEETAPPLGERPFLIGGLLALWLVEEDALPMDIWGGLLGNLSLLLEIRDEHARDIRPYHIPKTSTLRGLLKEAFPDALARGRRLEGAKRGGGGGRMMGSDALRMDDIYMLDDDDDKVGCGGAMLCKGKTVIATSSDENEEVVFGPSQLHTGPSTLLSVKGRMEKIHFSTD
ncbi:hypothetical protein V492_06889 [Pseudogymnoascus sp. VKM F-4246]|nr:hypothetical protein V492_06889 [Pseudogymnoascus sp. VKM F-4246]